MTSPPSDDPYEDRIDPQDEHTPIENDPTGMRALLSSLPDPGPMPPDVEQRLRAALSHEQEARARGEHNPVPLAAAPVHDLQRHREQRDQRPHQAAPRRPRRMHGLLVAAAVAGIAAAGGVGVFTAMGGPNAVVTALNGQDDVAGSAAEEQAPQSAATGATPPDQAVPNRAAPSSTTPMLEAAEVRIISSDDAYTTDDLAGQAGETAKRAAILLPAQGTGPLTTPSQVRSCTGALGIPSGDGVLVDLAEVDGKPAAVVIRQDGTGRLSAYAVARTCTAGDPATITGPVALR